MLVRSVVVLLGLAHVAVAQPRTELAREFQAGVDAFRLGKLDEARAHLERAKRLDPKLPGPHRFLAAVAQAQARWPDCIEAARTAIVLNPRSQELSDTRALHEACRIGAGRSPRPAGLDDSAAISVTSEPGAKVTIGGLSYGATPLAPRPIAAGPLEVEVVRAGFLPARIAVEAPAGIVTDVAIVLAPDPAARSTAGAEHADVQSASHGALVVEGGGDVRIDGARATPDGERFALSPGTHVVEVRRPARDLWRRRVRIAAGQRTVVVPAPIETAARERKRTAGLVLLGTGAALTGGAIVARARDADLVSNITFGAAAVSIGAGAVLLYLGRRTDGDHPPAFAVIPTAGGAVLCRATRF